MENNINNINMTINEDDTRVEQVLGVIDQDPAKIISILDNEILRKQMMIENINKEKVMGEQYIEQLNNPELTDIMNKIKSDEVDNAEIIDQVNKMKVDCMNKLRVLLQEDKELLQILTK